MIRYETWSEMCFRILTKEELEQNPYILKIGKLDDK